MPKPFDAATKELLESDPGAWVELILGRRFAEVRILNVDLSTVTAEADSVLSVADDVSWLVHLEFQSGYDPDLPLRLQRYNVLVNYRHRQPVQSAALLLCPGADGPALTGLFQQALPDGFLYHEFRYNVVRIWEHPAEEILKGGLGTLPLAPLGKVHEDDLPALIQTIRQRLDREAARNQVQALWTSTYLLMGLKYPEDLIERLFEGAQNMTESVTYQKILREGLAKGRAEGRTEGRAEEARRILKRLGTRRLGEPSPEFDAVIDAIVDLERLEQLADQVLDASSWQELIGGKVQRSG